MKGIILAGGSGSRLNPLTKIITKPLLPIYDKPMIYYPLSVLMSAGIKEILIISTPQDINKFKELLSDGSSLGISLSYEIQHTPKGIADALIIGESFIGNDNIALILGDNIFFGLELSAILQNSIRTIRGATLFGYYVNDPERFGVLSFDDLGKVVSVEEKPKNPQSNYIITGLYLYDPSVVQIAKSVQPSARGELEITDVNRKYLEKNSLFVEILGPGFAWFDTGTHDSLLEASNFVETIDKSLKLKIGCIEEIAYKMGYISRDQLITLAQPLMKNAYGEYLLSVAKLKKNH